MKFTASSADLLRALTTVGGAVPTKSTLPVLECILFTQEEGQLKLTATDLEISIVQSLPVQFDAASTGRNRIAVPAKRLLDTLRALPSLPISFAADEDFHITLKTDQGVYKMVGFDGADYPALPEISHKHTIELAGAVLRRAIQIARLRDFEIFRVACDDGNAGTGGARDGVVDGGASVGLPLPRSAPVRAGDRQHLRVAGADHVSLITHAAGHNDAPVFTECLTNGFE